MTRREKIRRLYRRTKLRVRIGAEILRHPETPWYVRTLAFLVVAYAVSPIDLIPDFIPVLGYLDDVILLPLGIALVIVLTPAQIRREAAMAAVRSGTRRQGPSRWIGGAAIVTLWLGVLFVILLRVIR